MKSHFLKENDDVLSSRWQFQDGRSKGMGTEWDKEVVGKVDPHAGELPDQHMSSHMISASQSPDHGLTAT